MAPTGPPLGIATLKSCLESSVGAEVRNFDLNLAYFEQAFGWADDGRLRMRLREMDVETTARKAVAARNFFQRGDNLDLFFNTTLYDEHSEIYTRFSAVLNGLFDSFARKILLGLPTPSLVKRFFDELVHPVRDFRPDLIGFSVLISQQLFFALALAKLCSEAPGRHPRIVFGGATFSVMPDPGRLLSGPVPVYPGDERGEVDVRSLIDYLIVGEGEKGLESLARLIDEERAATRQASAPGQAAPASGGRDTPGLVYVESGAVVQNPAQAAWDLGALPAPDFSDFPLDEYHSPVTVLPYLSSRGCSWRRCAFCTHQKTYLDYREEDASVSAQKLATLMEKYRVGHFCLVDEMVNPRRLERLSEEIVRRGVRLCFSAYAKPSGFSPGVFERAHEAGLRLLMWGLESASQRVLDLMCKGTSAWRIAFILDSARRAGVWNLLFVMFGFPTETDAERLETLGFLEAHRESIHALSRSRFVLLEGSEVFSNPGRFGISRIMDRPLRDPVSIAYDYEVTEGLTQKEASEMFERSLARLSAIGRSPWFGQFREHMLLFAANEPSTGAFAG
jgi:radical SAM superfamily enzyme YgiQ (UPF0313 family)